VKALAEKEPQPEKERQHSTRFPLVRTFFNSAYRTSSSVARNYLLTAIGLGIAIAGFLGDILLGILGVAVGIAGLIITYVIWRRDIRDLYLERLPDIDANHLSLSGELQDSHYQLQMRGTAPGDILLTSARVNEALFRGDSADLHVGDAVFRARHPVRISHVLMREFTRQKGKVLFNGKKIRLSTDPAIDSTGGLAPVSVQPTHYFDTLMTNDAVKTLLKSRNNGSVVFNGREHCFPQQEVPECSQSRCANQIGTSTTAITSDGYLVIVGQSEWNNFSKRLWAPAGSGSADWTDAQQYEDLQGFVKFAAQRELVEECGLSNRDVDSLKIMGYGRLIHRGGLPQFFCLAMLNCTFQEVKISRPERPLIDFHKQVYLRSRQLDRQSVAAAIDRLGEDEDKFSSQLYWSLHFLLATL
jgi:hypothetical protein